MVLTQSRGSAKSIVVFQRTAQHFPVDLNSFNRTFTGALCVISVFQVFVDNVRGVESTSLPLVDKESCTYKLLDVKLIIRKRIGAK